MKTENQIITYKCPWCTAVNTKERCAVCGRNNSIEYKKQCDELLNKQMEEAKLKNKEVTRVEWEQKNTFDVPRCCNNCRFYHHKDDELVEADDVTDNEKTFCRAMRDDDVKNYYLEDDEEFNKVCEKWMTEGLR
ncbi:MAG: hypothetical protein FWB95_02675 [Treponema sp.]|nr:hypothetical protein [Treponema sp.]